MFKGATDPGHVDVVDVEEVVSVGDVVCRFVPSVSPGGGEDAAVELGSVL